MSIVVLSAIILYMIMAGVTAYLMIRLVDDLDIGTGVRVSIAILILSLIWPVSILEVVSVRIKNE